MEQNDENFFIESDLIKLSPSSADKAAFAFQVCISSKEQNNMLDT